MAKYFVYTEQVNADRFCVEAENEDDARTFIAELMQDFAPEVVSSEPAPESVKANYRVKI